MEVAAISLTDLAPGTMTGIKQAGKSILVANVNGKFYAIGNTCTHMGCTLSDGILNGMNVQCVCHGSTFNVTTGAVVRGPATKPEPSFKVKVEGDQLSVVV